MPPATKRMVDTCEEEARKPLSDISAGRRTRENAMLSADSDSENETSAKKIKLEKACEGPKCDPSPMKTETPNRRRSRRSIIKVEETTPNVKKEKVKAREIKKEEKDDSPVGLSEYELQIQRNIEERLKFMESLEIFNAKENLLELTPKTPKSTKKEYRGIAREPKTPIRPEEIRRSLRQQKLTPDGANLTLPSDRQVFLSDAYREPEHRDRPSVGPAPMMDYYKSHNTEDCQNFVSELPKITTGSQGKESIWSGSTASVLKVMKTMVIDDKHVAKVTPQRTFSIQVHPSEDKTLVLIGAKWGELGVWDVERNDETSGAYYFNVHSRPINCLTLHSSNPERVYTTSYDGSVRRTDLVSGIVQEVYSYCEQGINNRYISWHAHQDENCLLVGSSEGLAVHVDLREPAKTATRYGVHQKSVKVVTVHPTHNSYFATASLTCVRLWDMRNLKKHKFISEVVHGRVVNGLEFSPVTGNRLVTSSKDNYIRILSCDLKTLTTTRKIRHNNDTGRWLSTFKPRFVPHCEDLIVIGSMEYPRRIEVFDTEGNLQWNFKGESLSSITSVTAMHPTRPILAGSNSSGKAFVFTTQEGEH